MTRPRAGRIALLAFLAVLLAGAAMVWVRFHTDIIPARLRVAQGSTVIDTPCGRIEHQEAGKGLPLLTVHRQWRGLSSGHGLCRHAGGEGRLRNGPGPAGLIPGLVWAVWHLPAEVRYNISAMGWVWPLEFAIVYLATLTPWRIVMTLVYARTRSLFLAILMHASLTGWLMVLFPPARVAQRLAWQALFALILWAFAAAFLTRPQASDAPV